MKLIILLCCVSLSFAFSRLIGTHQPTDQDGNGDVRYVNIITISSDYTVAPDDFTVIVKQSGTKITLPDYERSKGRLVAIKNASEGNISVRGTIYPNPNAELNNDGGERVIQAEKSLLFQNDGKYWIPFNFSK